MSARAARVVEWIREHVRLAVIGYVLLAVSTALSLGWLVDARDTSCRDRKHSWDALSDVIHTAYAPSAPSDAVLNAFPQLKPFYTPGSPQYVEQQHSLEAQRNRVLTKLGDRPVC